MYLNVALYASCYQLQRPVEPFLIETLSKANLDAQSDDKVVIEMADISTSPPRRGR